MNFYLNRFSWGCVSKTVMKLGSTFSKFTKQNNGITSAAAAAKSLQSCPTLCDPVDCSLPGSSIHGIFQARVLEWGAIAFSRTTYRVLEKPLGLVEVFLVFEMSRF